MSKVHQIQADLPVLSIKHIIDDLIVSLLKADDFNGKHQILVNKFYQEFLQGLIVKEPYLCHGDLNFSNILLEATKDSRNSVIQIIDFECACIADREFDLAMMVAINQLSLDDVELFLEEYSKYTNYQVVLNGAMVTRYLIFSHLINGLWYLGQKDKLGADEGLELAKQQFSLLNKLTDYDFSSLLV